MAQYEQFIQQQSRIEEENKNKYKLNYIPEAPSKQQSIWQKLGLCCGETRNFNEAEEAENSDEDSGNEAQLPKDLRKESDPSSQAKKQESALSTDKLSSQQEVIVAGDLQSSPQLEQPANQKTTEIDLNSKPPVTEEASQK